MTLSDAAAGRTGKREHSAAIAELVQLICETPAPTFAEADRARLVASLWRDAGLEPRIDELDNVIAAVPGGSGPHVLLAAHSDTVFPAGTDVTVQRAGGRWLAPGIGDNSSSLAVLTFLLTQLASLDGLPRITVAAPTGEEGRGDLRGMRHLLRNADDYDLMIAVDGNLGTVINQAVGSKRFEFTFSAPGGHSWGDYPGPSAIHALADAMSALNGLQVPADPRSSYNLGTVSGGTSINAIAQSARFDLDLRSVDAGALARLEAAALALVREAAARHGVQVEVSRIGDRPAANVDNSALTRAALEALRSVGLEPVTAAGSTDANAALAHGIPAISFGVYRGGDAHRLSEWLDPASLGTGYAALVALLRNLPALPSRS
jgi:acetylornithine deacetylase/succinyl-diaminopimelate desuccinylase-like protein